MKPYTLTFILLGLIFQLHAQRSGKFRGFSFDQFQNQPELSFVGNAYAPGPQAQLVDDINWQKGALWYSERMLPVEDEFTTEFEFRISKPCKCKGGADGVVLVMHTNENPVQLGEDGEGIGYAGISNSLAIEFDAFDNNEGSDHHVSIQTRRNMPNSHKNDASIAMNHALPSLKSGEVHKVRIAYKRGRMKVMMDDMNTPVLDAYLKIDQIISLKRGQAWMGLTASTGGGKARHEILSWSFEGKGWKNPPRNPQPPIASATPRPRPVVRPEPRPEPEPVPTRADEDEPILPPSQTMTELEGRPVTPPTRIIEVASKDLTISLWDHNKKDGDIVSMNLNGTWVINSVKLKYRKQDFYVRLSEEDNQLILYAHNLGKIPPNTASIAINDGIKRSVFVLTSNMGASSSVAVRYRPREEDN
ncbi:MAG: L-type lectin-domain containing protein [Bacteroidota bacterium]